MVVPADIPAVIAELDALVGPLPQADGVACFARLYVAVTRGVQQRLTAITFADETFLERLDVAFADLFFDAFAAFQRGPEQAPRAWEPLFAMRARHGIAPLQFALAGMNAHINRDLPVALVAVCQELDVTLASGSPQHHDFEAVNNVLATVEADVKRQYLTGWLQTFDRLLHRASRIDDIAAMWNIQRARDAAWTNGQALWAIRDDPALRRDYLAVLDRSVGLAGRGLLVPADTWLQRLARTLG
jgi:hypothetical protein